MIPILLSYYNTISYFLLSISSFFLDKFSELVFDINNEHSFNSLNEFILENEKFGNVNIYKVQFHVLKSISNIQFLNTHRQI